MGRRSRSPSDYRRRDDRHDDRRRLRSPDRGDRRRDYRDDERYVARRRGGGRSPTPDRHRSRHERDSGRDGRRRRRSPSTSSNGRGRDPRRAAPVAPSHMPAAALPLVRVGAVGLSAGMMGAAAPVSVTAVGAIPGVVTAVPPTQPPPPSQTAAADRSASPPAVSVPASTPPQLSPPPEAAVEDAPAAAASPPAPMAPTKRASKWSTAAPVAAPVTVLGSAPAPTLASQSPPDGAAGVFAPPVVAMAPTTAGGGISIGGGAAPALSGGPTVSLADVVSSSVAVAQAAMAPPDAPAVMAAPVPAAPEAPPEWLADAERRRKVAAEQLAASAAATAAATAAFFAHAGASSSSSAGDNGSDEDAAGGGEVGGGEAGGEDLDDWEIMCGAGPSKQPEHAPQQAPVSGADGGQATGGQATEQADGAAPELSAAGLQALLSAAGAAARRTTDDDDAPPANGDAAGAGAAAAAAAAGPMLMDDVDAAARGAAKSALPAKADRGLRPFDHSTYEYPPLRKDFFIPPADVDQLSGSEVAELRRQLDGAKVWGTGVPPPIKTWLGIGLGDNVMAALQERDFTRPFAVQSVAIPILMAGRDLLAIAKTGSGKTLAFLMPLLRHVLFQPRCGGTGEGPIAVIIEPTHELAMQVYRVVNDFCKALRLTALPAYGGTTLHHNIEAVRRGVDVLVATPGRLFDLLVARRGKVVQLRRASFVVIDEADRLLDDGFGPHVAAVLQQARPDRQIAMVSSTLPSELRGEAKRLLAHDFIELSVGGRPSPSTNITQTVEIFDLPGLDGHDDGAEGDVLLRLHDMKPIDDPRMRRLLQILGVEKPGSVVASAGADTEAAASLGGEIAVKRGHGIKSVIIFVNKQDACDMLYGQLLQFGYDRMVGVLCSKMDQIDRELALTRFTNGERPILIATSVAERGIDVVDLSLVINYDMPDHYEAYVNRIGRTGRAGRKGKAVTFMIAGMDQDEAMAGRLAEALEESDNDVPARLHTIAQAFKEKVKKGIVKVAASSYFRGFRKGQSYRFDKKEKGRTGMSAEERLAERRKAQEARAAAKAQGLELSSDSDGESSGGYFNSDEEGGGRRRRRDPEIKAVTGDGAQSTALVEADMRRRLGSNADARLIAARALAMAITAEANSTAGAGATRREAFYPVNDFGTRLRKRLINATFLKQTAEATGTSIVVKGVYTPRRGGGIREQALAKLHGRDGPLRLQIRGETEEAITTVFRALDAVIEEESERASEGLMTATGKFTGKVVKRN